MLRRWTLRARTDCRVRTRQGSLVAEYRGIELSPTGILIDRGRPVELRDQPLYVDMEILLPERIAALYAVARPVWSFGSQQAFKFVRISDVDRLSLAEHVDLTELRHAHSS